MINTAAKSVLVQLCYYMTWEFLSTFSRIKRQFLQKSASNLLKSRAGRVGNRKYIFKLYFLCISIFLFPFKNGISTILRRLLSMKTLRLFWGSWIMVTSPLMILNWRSEMLRMSTPKKIPARLFKSDGPWRCLNWLVLQQENLLMLTAVLLWCHQLPFERTVKGDLP